MKTTLFSCEFGEKVHLNLNIIQKHQEVVEEKQSSLLDHPLVQEEEKVEQKPKTKEEKIIEKSSLLVSKLDSDDGKADNKLDESFEIAAPG